MNVAYNNYPQQTYDSRSGFPSPTGYTKSGNNNSRTFIVGGVVLVIVALVVVLIVLISKGSTNNTNTPTPDAQTGTVCDPNPCKHGKCTAVDESYTCACSTGYQGDLCDQVVAEDSPCAQSPCKNKGVCSEDGNGGFTCECVNGYTGDTCATAPIVTSPCSSTPCKNGGTCTKSGTGYTCTCKTGFSGKTCQTADDVPPTDPCATNPCLNGGSCVATDGSCNCKTGFSGSKCETAQNVTKVCNPTCQNGGTCKDGVCQCTSSWIGNACTTAVCTIKCNNGGTCDTTTGKSVCKCATGYSGDTCDTVQCSKTCQNGGTCKVTGTTSSCTCASGYSGDTCQTKDSNPPVGQTCTSNPITISTESKRGDISGSNCKNYKYELWVADSMKSGNKAVMTVTGTNAAFKVDWQINGGQSDFVARAGYGYDSTKTAAQLAPIKATFTYKKQGTGQAWVGLYGWTYSPLMEYYVVEDWNEWRPTYQRKGQITVDGVSYEVYTNTQTNQPSINGTQTFPQIYSVALNGVSHRTSGTMTVSDHFAEWNKMGLQAGGKLYEAMLVVEGMKAQGMIEFTSASVTDGGS